MPGSLTSHLRGLEPDDLLALLQHRTELKPLLEDNVRKDIALLADLLALPYGIRAAQRQLNTSLSQLLQVVVWLGPRVSAAALAEQIPGVRMEALREAARELSRWGLAFMDERGSKGAGDWWVDVPACTTAAVAMPHGFGPPARRLLGRRTIHFVATVSRNIGLPVGPRPGQEAMVAELSAALSEPDRVRRLLDEAPPKASTLFTLIQANGGSIGRRELMSAGHVRWSDPPWSERRKVMTPLDWLESHGLVVYDEGDGYTGSAVIPAEVELALRGGRLFESWPPRPEPVTQPAPAASHPGDPSRVLGDLEAVIDEWGLSRPPCLQRGGLGVRELKKTAKTLGFAERYVSFLYALAVELELVGVDQENHLVASPRLKWWTELTPPERWSWLLGAWQRTNLWTEYDDGLVPLDKVDYMPWLTTLRSAVLSDLADLPPATGTTVPSLAGRLAWFFPNLIHLEDAGLFVERCVEALAWLGTATPGTPIALLEPGRSAAHNRLWEEGNPGLAAFPPEVDSCTVGADLQVIVPGPPVHELRSALGRFADMKASWPARIYQISEASVRRALDTGMQVPEIISVLERHATKGIPQNVAYLIQDVGRRHGHLVAGLMGLYLRSDDPGLLRSAAADRRLAAFHPRLIAPTVAVMEGRSVPALLAALRNAGYMPVAEPGGGLLSEGPAGEGQAQGVGQLMRPAERPWRMTREQAAGLVERFLAGAAGTARAAGPTPAAGPKLAAEKKAPSLNVNAEPSTNDDGRTLTRAKDIRKAMRAAVQQSLVVEIAYRSPKGETRRFIEPLEVDGERVAAWCRLRDEERVFMMSRIAWARVTEETFDLPSFEGLFDGAFEGE